MTKVTVIGTGYVGLVTGACLAHLGVEVVCLDIDEQKINSLNAGHVPIYEPGLSEIVASSIEKNLLTFTTDVVSATEHGQFQFIAVGTPPRADGSANTDYVMEAARNIGRFANQSCIVIDKSTVPVGTADLVAEVIQKELSPRDVEIQISVVSNPEFLREGAAVDDFFNPDRIVLGTNDTDSIAAMERLYAPLISNGAEVITSSPRSAELIKYAANAMLATRISFMNELSEIAEAVGADIEDVRLGMGSDPRIGPSFLRAGAGYGGSCFPKDVQALAHMAQNNADVVPELLLAVESVNTKQKHVLTKKLVDELGDLRGKTIGVWGLAFKPETDDMREATSIVLIHDLIQAGAQVKAYDPIAHESARAAMPKLPFAIVDSAEVAARDADALVLVTEWAEFTQFDIPLLSKLMRGKVIIDGRNYLDGRQLTEAGLIYNSIGRPRRV